MKPSKVQERVRFLLTLASWCTGSWYQLYRGIRITRTYRIQFELDKANEVIDDKLDRLEDAGVGVISLTQQLEDAKTKVTMLEVEITRITRRDERRMKRLQKLRCQKCRVKVDLTPITEINGDES